MVPIKGQARKLAVIRQASQTWAHTMSHWRYFEHLATNHDDNATLANIPWDKVLSRTLHLAFFGPNSSAPPPATVKFRLWEAAVKKFRMDTVDGMADYLCWWKAQDEFVREWAEGNVIVDPASADIGGWLADYMNTLFLVLTHQAKPTTKYKVVDNKIYRSTLELLFPTTLSANNAGNAMEQLCWHALERGTEDACVFILAMIWNTTNRVLTNVPHNLPSRTSSSDHNTATSSSVIPPANTERRVARDGRQYTFAEFQQFYGESLALQKWSQCGKTVVPPHAEEQQAQPAGANPGTNETMQCPQCKRHLCDVESLCFFARHNRQGGHEVHLMMKPEIATLPKTFVLAKETKERAIHSWQCACGHELGDTRNIGPKFATMTAFKSASVMLYGQHHPGKKSKWPTLYQRHPYNQLEVRDRASHSGV